MTTKASRRSIPRRRSSRTSPGPRSGDALPPSSAATTTPSWKERQCAIDRRFTGLNAQAAPKKVTFDPAKDEAFPKAMAVSANRTPRWTDTRDAIMFGIAPLTKVDRPAGARGAGAAGQRGRRSDAPADGSQRRRCRRDAGYGRSPRFGDLALQGLPASVAAAGAGGAADRASIHMPRPTASPSSKFIRLRRRRRAVSDAGSRRTAGRAARTRAPTSSTATSLVARTATSTRSTPRPVSGN